MSCRPSSIQEQSGFGVLYHPFQPFWQIQASHGAACHDVPFVCADGVELQALCPLAPPIGPTTGLHTHLAHFVLGHGAGNIALVLEDKQACS
jgi:hypothetical protein